MNLSRPVSTELCKHFDINERSDLIVIINKRPWATISGNKSCTWLGTSRAQSIRGKFISAINRNSEQSLNYRLCARNTHRYFLVAGSWYFIAPMTKFPVLKLFSKNSIVRFIYAFTYKGCMYVYICEGYHFRGYFARYSHSQKYPRCLNLDRYNFIDIFQPRVRSIEKLCTICVKKYSIFVKVKIVVINYAST